MPPKLAGTRTGDHVWTPRRHKRYDAKDKVRTSLNPYDPRTIPAGPPERRLVAPAPCPPSASAPGLWQPRGSNEQQLKTMVDLLGVDTNKAYCGRYHFSPRKQQAVDYRLQSPYGHHPDHRKDCEAGLDMGLIRDHDLPVCGDHTQHSGGLGCSAQRRSRSAPPPKDTSHSLRHDDHLIERSARREENRHHGHGPKSYNFSESPAALCGSQAPQSSKACTPKPTAAQRSVLTGSGVWVPSRFEGLSVDQRGSTSRRAQTPAPQNLIRGSCVTPRHELDAADGWAKASKISKRVDTSGSERRNRIHDLISSKFEKHSGHDVLDYSHYGTNLQSRDVGPGRRLYPGEARSHSNNDLWGADSKALKRTQRKQYGAGPGERLCSHSAPGTPRRVAEGAPFDQTYSGPTDSIPRNLQSWRPWRRRLRCTSPFAPESQMLGHSVVNGSIGADYTSGRFQSPRPPHSFGGSGLSWTREDACRPAGKSCSLTPERRRVAVSNLSGAGAVHDVGPGFNPHQGQRGKNCQSPARPRDSFQGSGMEMQIL